MQVAYIETSCHCDEDGFEALTWSEAGAVRPALPNEDPVLRLMCSTCTGTRVVRVAVAVDHHVEPVSEEDLRELSEELFEVLLLIEEQEATRPFVTSYLLERREELRPVAELLEFDGQIKRLEHQGVLVTPAVLRRRADLQAMVRGLLPAPA